MKKYMKMIGNLLAVLSIIFVIYSLFHMDIKIEQISNWKSLVLIIIIGSIISVGTVFLLGFAWAKNIQFFSSQKIDYKKAIRIYGKANLGKYIPGNVMHYVERNVFAAEMGLDQAETAISSILEVIGLIIAAVLLSVIISFDEIINVFASILSGKVIVILVIAFLIVLFLLIIILRKSEKCRLILLKMKDLRFVKVLVINILIYMLVFFVLGIMLLIIVNILNSDILSLRESIITLSAYTIAWVAGFIVPGAPGGIGVREMVISIITQGTGLKSLILLAAVIHRMVTVIGDVITYVIGECWNNRKLKRKM